jgi:hypothetical protein
MLLTKLSLAGSNSGQGDLVSDILAGDEKNENLFYSRKKDCGRNEKWGGLAFIEKRVQGMENEKLMTGGQLTLYQRSIYLWQRNDRYNSPL